MYLHIKSNDIVFLTALYHVYSACGTTVIPRKNMRNTSTFKLSPTRKHLKKKLIMIYLCCSCS